MTRNRWLLFIPVAIISCTGGLVVAEARTRKTEHRVLACDKGKAAIVNAKGEVEWEYGNIGECHDVWMLANGNILLPLNSNTVAEITPAKKIVWRYEAKPKPG